MADITFKTWLNDDNLLIVKGYARDGLTNREIASNIGITAETFSRWVTKSEQLNQALKEGRKPVNIAIEDTFFEKKLKGYFVDETVTDTTIQKNPGGDITGITEHTRTVKKYIPPDTTALIFTLKCRLPNRYNEKQLIELETNKDGILQKLIEGLKE